MENGKQRRIFITNTIHIMFNHFDDQLVYNLVLNQIKVKTKLNSS